MTVFEGFGMFGKALPGDAFCSSTAARSAGRRRGREQEVLLADRGRQDVTDAALGTRVVADGRSARRAEPCGAPTDWDIVPQLQVSLSGLQHVLLNVGLRIPVNQPVSRARR